MIFPLPYFILIIPCIEIYPLHAYTSYLQALFIITTLQDGPGSIIIFSVGRLLSTEIE